MTRLTRYTAISYGVLSQFRKATSEFRFAISEFRSAVPEFRFAISEFRSAVPEFRFVISEFRSVVPEFRSALPEFRSVVPEFRFVLSKSRPCSETSVGRVEFSRITYGQGGMPIRNVGTPSPDTVLATRVLGSGRRSCSRTSASRCTSCTSRSSGAQSLTYAICRTIAIARRRWRSISIHHDVDRARAGT